MTPLEERLHQLKAESEDLKIISEEREIGFNKVKEFMGIIGKIDTETEKGKEIFQQGARKYLDAELEYLRDKSNIIRKVSPKTANFLENKINDYDKTTNEVLEIIKNNSEDSSPWESLAHLFLIAKTIYYIGHLHGIVTVSCDSFFDTIAYLEGNKSE